MQTDPIGYEAGANLYGYVGGDPINFTDPFGLDPFCVSHSTSGIGPGGEVVITGHRTTCDTSLLSELLSRGGEFLFGGGGALAEPPGQCAVMGYIQRDISVSATGFLGSLGRSYGFGVRLSTPARYMGLPGSGTQLAFITNRTTMVGLGAFAGVGVGAGANLVSGPIGASGSRELSGVVAADAALIGGAGGQVTWDQNGGLGAGGGVKALLGGGAFAGYGDGKPVPATFNDVIDFTGSEDHVRGVLNFGER